MMGYPVVQDAPKFLQVSFAVIFCISFSFIKEIRIGMILLTYKILRILIISALILANDLGLEEFQDIKRNNTLRPINVIVKQNGKLKH